MSNATDNEKKIIRKQIRRRAVFQVKTFLLTSQTQIKKNETIFFFFFGHENKLMNFLACRWKLNESERNSLRFGEKFVIRPKHKQREQKVVWKLCREALQKWAFANFFFFFSILIIFVQALS